MANGYFIFPFPISTCLCPIYFLIHVVLSQDRVTRGTQMKSRMEKLLKRSSAALSEDEQRLVEALERLTILNLRPQKDYSQKEGIIQCVTKAILQKERCLVEYYFFHKKKNIGSPFIRYTSLKAKAAFM